MLAIAGCRERQDDGFERLVKRKRKRSKKELVMLRMRVASAAVFEK